MPPKPIRYDASTWMCMRNSETEPKAIIRRYRTHRGDLFLVERWSLDPDERALMAKAATLQDANELVRYDVRPSDEVHAGPPNGRREIGGAHKRESTQTQKNPQSRAL